MQSPRRITRWLNIWFPFLLGILIYCVFGNSWHLSRLEEKHLLFKHIRELVYINVPTSALIGRIIHGYASDVLWAYSLGWASLMAKMNAQKGFRFAIVVAYSQELIQLWPATHSTFDWCDMIYETLAILLATVIWRHCVIKNPKEIGA